MCFHEQIFDTQKVCLSQKSKKQATDSGKGYQKDSCLGKHSLARARMTDYMRQDLLREEQTSRDGYSVRDTVSSPPHPSLARAAS